MCLILFSKPKDGNYNFILTSNRDEFYERKTKNMFWWNETKGLLAGQDLEQKEHGLEFQTKKEFAAVTNVREFYKLRENQIFI